MISTSASYKTAIRDTIRQFRGKIQITWRAAGIDPTMQVSTNDNNYGMFGEGGIATRPRQAADEKITATRKWAHLDGTLKSDGTFYPMPSDAQASYSQVGWWGATRCDGSAQWSAFPTLTVTFEEGPLFMLRVCGDQIYNEYPVDFDIKVYDSTDALIRSETITGNTLLDWTKAIDDEEINDAAKMELTVKKWSTPNRVVKILEFYSPITEEYSGDDLISLDLLEEREISNGTLPVGNISANELDVRLQNIGIESKVEFEKIRDPFSYGNDLSPYLNVLKLNRKITAWIGVRLADTSYEYVKLGTFWSGDWNASDKDVAVSTSCRDRLELLRKSEFSESLIYEDITAYALLEIVLNHAMKNVSWLSDMTWDIDSALNESEFTIPLAFFPRQSYFECIRQIVEACMAQAYMSREDVLIITGPSFTGNETSYSVTKDDYFDKTQPSKSEELRNSIRIPVTSMVAQEEPTEVFRSTYAESIDAGEERTIIVEYSSYPVASPDATLESASSGIMLDKDKSRFYACLAAIVVRNDAGSAGTCIIVISGLCFDKKSDLVVEVNDDASQLEFGVLRYEYLANNLLQKQEMANKIAGDLLNIYKVWRKDVSLDWRGDPSLELGDLIEVPEYQRFTVDKRANFLIYKNHLAFDGTLRATTDARKISDA